MINVNVSTSKISINVSALKIQGVFKNHKFFSVSKFWHLELFWRDLLCNLTLRTFRGHQIKKTPIIYWYLCHEHAVEACSHHQKAMIDHTHYRNSWKTGYLFSVTLLAPAFFNLSDALEVPGAVKVRMDLNLFSPSILDYFSLIFSRKSQAYVLYGLLWNLGTKATPKDESGQKVSSLLTFTTSNC